MYFSYIFFLHIWYSKITSLVFVSISLILLESNTKFNKHFHSTWKMKVSCYCSRQTAQSKQNKQQRRGKWRKMLEILTAYSLGKQKNIICFSFQSWKGCGFSFALTILQFRTLSKALFTLLQPWEVSQVLSVSNKKHVSSRPYLFTPLDLFYFFS